MMNEIETSKKSNLIEWIDTKTSSIMEFLDTFFNDKEIALKIGDCNLHPVFVKWLSTNNDYSKMNERKFDNAEEVLHCLDQYQNIMAKINLKVPFIPSIENFCMFMGWTAKIYKNHLEYSNDDIKDVMNMINDYIIESQYSAGMLGFAKANLSKFRLQGAGEHGTGIVTQKEQNDDNAKIKKLMTKEELERALVNRGAHIQNYNKK